jgi:ribosome biogenesis protein Nip4
MLGSISSILFYYIKVHFKPDLLDSKIEYSEIRSILNKLMINFIFEIKSKKCATDLGNISDKISKRNPLLLTCYFGRKEKTINLSKSFNKLEEINDVKYIEKSQIILSDKLLVLHSHLIDSKHLLYKNLNKNLIKKIFLKKNKIECILSENMEILDEELTEMIIKTNDNPTRCIKDIDKYFNNFFSNVDFRKFGLFSPHNKIVRRLSFLISILKERDLNNFDTVTAKSDAVIIS